MSQKPITPEIVKEPKKGKAKKADAVVVQKQNTALATAPKGMTEIGYILQLAIENNISVESLEKLVALKERSEDRAAAALFNKAVSDFQAECPSIAKKGKASFPTKGGVECNYTFAELPDIQKVIREPLLKHGLSYSWNGKVVGNSMHTVCKLRHVAGHMETSEFDLPIDNNSAMSAQQKVSAAYTTGKRQSLVAALGLSTDKDMDGSYTTGPKITEAQAHTLEEYIMGCAAPDVERAAFLNYMKVAKLTDIPEKRYEHALLSIKKVHAARGAK